MALVTGENSAQKNPELLEQTTKLNGIIVQTFC